MRGGNVDRPVGGQPAAAHWKQPERPPLIRRSTKEASPLPPRGDKEEQNIPPPRSCIEEAGDKSPHLRSAKEKRTLSPLCIGNSRNVPFPFVAVQRKRLRSHPAAIRKSRASRRRALSRRSSPAFSLPQPYKATALPRIYDKAGPSPRHRAENSPLFPISKLPIPHQPIKEDMQQCRHGLKNSRRTSC